MKKFIPQNFNDLLCLIVMGMIFTLWLLSGYGKINLNPEVLGASIAFFTIIGQYYFRKAKTGDSDVRGENQNGHS